VCAVGEAGGAAVGVRRASVTAEPGRRDRQLKPPRRGCACRANCAGRDVGDAVCQAGAGAAGDDRGGRVCRCGRRSSRVAASSASVRRPGCDSSHRTPRRGGAGRPLAGRRVDPVGLVTLGRAMQDPAVGGTDPKVQAVGAAKNGGTGVGSTRVRRRLVAVIRWPVAEYVTRVADRRSPTAS
jgi:hypothetical protein